MPLLTNSSSPLPARSGPSQTIRACRSAVAMLGSFQVGFRHRNAQASPVFRTWRAVGAGEIEVGVYWWVWQGLRMRCPPPGLRPVRYAYAPPSVEKLLGSLPVVAELCRRLDV